jgi:hypothetical protein
MVAVWVASMRQVSRTAPVLLAARLTLPIPFFPRV